MKMLLKSAILALCLITTKVMAQAGCRECGRPKESAPEPENLYEKIVVQVTQGELRGYKLHTYLNKQEYYVFQGIPYAEAPLGELRFQPPKPVEAWTGIYNATRTNLKCPQKDAFFEFFSEGNEDCLFLNVYTPKVDKNNFQDLLPVMFWVHGGGFTTGSGSSDLYGPDFLMEENVIVVTVNYRLGALGFMNLQDEYASGNMGLKDVVMALKWVKDNIHIFSGDHNRVTIFGSDAGGSMVNLLLHCPQAKGYFSQAICQSGVARMPGLFDEDTVGRAFTLGRKLKKNVTTSAALVKGLESANLYEMARVTPYIIDSSKVRNVQKPILPFAPSVEKWLEDALITSFPEEFEPKDVANVPIMIGFNSKESVFYLKDLVNSPDVLEKKDYNFQFLVPIRDLQFEYNSEDYVEVAKEIKKFYFEEGVIKNDSINEYVDYVSDTVFYPTDKTVSSYLDVKRKKPIYYYRFSYDGMLNLFSRVILNSDSPIRGASNGDEICYLFMCNRIKELYDDLHIRPVVSKEFEMIRKMARLWSNFAKYGNPTPGSNTDDEIFGEDFQWLPAKKGQHQVLDIGKNLTMVLNPVQSSVHFWDTIYSSYLLNKESPHLKRDEL